MDFENQFPDTPIFITAVIDREESSQSDFVAHPADYSHAHPADSTKSDSCCENGGKFEADKMRMSPHKLGKNFRTGN